MLIPIQYTHLQSTNIYSISTFPLNPQLCLAVRVIIRVRVVKMNVAVYIFRLSRL